MRWSPVALVCTSAILFATAAAAQDPYSAFRIPEARSFTWLVNGTAQWNRSYFALPNQSSDSRAGQGAASTSAHRHAESEAHTTDLLLLARGSWLSRRSSNQSFTAFSSNAGDDASDRDVYAVNGSASTTRYLGESSWGFDADVAASYGYVRDAGGSGNITTSGPSEFRNRSDREIHDYQGSLSADLGPGYGRVRDVTGVFDMQVLEERLQATGRLVHPLSPTARQRLAELFSVSGDFLAAHDRPDRYLWREVERLLREDGAIEAGTFDAWSLMRALEPATLSIRITRLAGWRLSGVYQLEANRGHTDLDQQSSYVSFNNGVPTGSLEMSSSTRSTVHETHGFARADADVHRPFGMRWQMDIRGSGLYGDGPARQVTLLSSLALTYVLADRWVAMGGVTQSATSVVADSTRLSPGWSVGASAQLSYFFEDSWSVTAGVSQIQIRPMFTSGGSSAPQGFLRQSQIVIGLTYRPVGRFEAPGLGVSERLAPGGI